MTKKHIAGASLSAGPDHIEEDGLLRPEPKPESGGGSRNGFALFGLAFAALALFAIYISPSVDLPEFPDCPIQAIGTCGHR